MNKVKLELGNNAQKKTSVGMEMKGWARDLEREDLFRKQEAPRTCVLNKCNTGFISVDQKIGKQTLFTGGREGCFYSLYKFIIKRPTRQKCRL